MMFGENGFAEHDGIAVVAEIYPMESGAFFGVWGVKSL